MSNALQTLTTKLATQFDMGDGSELVNTLKATCFKGSTQVSDAQMTALLVVANQYGLNPFTKEIFAFPDKGGIVPVVGVDGWARIINSHAQFDGIEFEQNAESCTCIIFRKDRSHATKVTEYMIECCRDVGPWKSHPYRMLRHKAMIQCARLAFGFVGIYDRDEAERIVENTSPTERLVNPETGEITAKPEALKPYSDKDFQTHLAKWQSLIESGRKTAKQVIATISTKSVLSPEQIAMIESAENIIEA